MNNFSINFWRFKTWYSVTKNFTCPKNLLSCARKRISCSNIFVHLAMHSNVYEVWAFRWVTMFACHCTTAVTQHAFLVSYICFFVRLNSFQTLWRKYSLTHTHLNKREIILCAVFLDPRVYLLRHWGVQLLRSNDLSSFSLTLKRISSYRRRPRFRACVVITCSFSVCMSCSGYSTTNKVVNRSNTYK